ncbi:hypothetical protein RE428_06130 [Marinobacter nanhaiticus D15-8W]|nr:hypothetical protein RE428_06130 [Marinobacter nanhaiticus D15-8W]
MGILNRLNPYLVAAQANIAAGCIETLIDQTASIQFPEVEVPEARVPQSQPPDTSRICGVSDSIRK